MSRNGVLSPWLFAGAALLAVILLFGCGSDPEPTPSPTPMPTVTPAPLPSPTPEPTATPAPTAAPAPTPAPLPARKSFIPQGATVIVDAKPSEILGSSVAESALDALLDGALMPEGFFDDFESNTGVSLRSLEFAEGYVDIVEIFETSRNGAGGSENVLPEMGIAARGAIDEDELASRLTGTSRADTGPHYEAMVYRGHNLYVEAQGKPGSLAFSVVEEDTLLFGTEEGVQAMLDVASGVAPQISGESVHALDRLGDRNLGVILTIPEGLLDAEMAGGDGSGSPMAMLGLGGLTPDLTLIALLFSGDYVSVHTAEFYEDESAAAAAKEYSENTIAMVGSLFGSPELQELIDSSVITQDGNRVSYQLNVDESAMSAILDFLTSFVAIGSGRTQN